MTDLNLYETQDETISLSPHRIDLRPPRLTFCPHCYKEQCYHIEDEVCIACGYSKTELD